MSRAKHSDEYEIEVAGETYVWRLQRRPHWSKLATERRGMAVAVRHSDGQREAILQFPAGPQPKLGAPAFKASQVDTRLVANAIASALAAGWEPQSRGRTVEIIVDEAGG